MQTSVWLQGLFVAGIVAMLAIPVGAQTGRQGTPAVSKAPRAAQQLTVLVTDDPIAARKAIPVLTSGNDFAEVFVPAAASIVRQGKSVSLRMIKPGYRLVCHGDWTDATRSVFRVIRVEIEGPAPPGEFRERVALACRRLSGRTRPARVPGSITSAPVPPTGNPISAVEAFVMDNATLERNDEGVKQPGTDYAPYLVQGILRNISGNTYDRVEIQLSILDRDGKKLGDQTAVTQNVRPGDRWQFRAEPPVFLPYRQGQSIRLEKVTVVPRVNQ